MSITADTSKNTPGNTSNAYFVVPPEPATKLGRHRQLCPLAGIHVSPICLGGMNIGDKWADLGLGAMDKESSFKLLDAFYEAGGNFVDTSSNYQDETSEAFIGEWMEARGVRDQMVIATKYSSQFKRRAPILQKSQFAGNSLKNMRVSVDASLKKLRTSYIDILYVHWWDFDTSIEEVMDGLNDLIHQGKVLYLGISDTPAWVVSMANQYARDHGKRPFSVYQGAWNVMQRDFEREIIPMCRVQGMAIAPWNVLAAGKIRTDEEEEKRRATGEKGRTLFGVDWERTAEERKVCLALEEVAKQVGAKYITSVAIAYVMQKTPYVFPIIGGRKIEHLMANIEALEISLSDEQIKYLESVQPFDLGFPAAFIGDPTTYGPWARASFFHIDKWPASQPIRPAQK
ncbi:Aldo/keto reductase [Obba rivulosa]|uniref:Aldo/keto reductase n=1 Tax=Obba rivulosa TaxID=1052685 RepID=A0A8E2DKB7_9APHY|nr:Aldo/keto reductase [Obba rivulosa]